MKILARMGVPRRATLLRFSAAVVPMLVVPAVAFCSGQGAHHEPSIADLTWYGINFSVFLLIVYLGHRWAGRPIPAAWASRASQIEKDITEGRAALAESHTRHEAAELQLREADRHVQDLVARLRAETTHETAQIVQHAERRGELLIAQAKRNAGLERRAAEQAIFGEFVEQVVGEATRRLRAELTLEADRERRLAGVRLVKDLRGVSV